MISDSLDSLRELPSTRKKKFVRASLVCQHYLHEPARRRVVSYFHRTFQVDFVGFCAQRRDGSMPPKTDLDSGSDPVFFFGGGAPLRNGHVVQALPRN